MGKSLCVKLIYSCKFSNTTLFFLCKLKKKKKNFGMERLAGVQPLLIQGIRSGDGIGDLFI